MKVSDVARTVVPKGKVIGYLLSPTHPDGMHKAAFFTSIGFARDRWEELAKELESQAHTYDVVLTLEGEFGTKYVVEGPLDSPDGRNPKVRSIWIVETDSSEAVLVTAYPAD